MPTLKNSLGYKGICKHAAGVRRMDFLKSQMFSKTETHNRPATRNI